MLKFTGFPTDFFFFFFSRLAFSGGNAVRHSLKDTISVCLVVTQKSMRLSVEALSRIICKDTEEFTRDPGEGIKTQRCSRLKWGNIRGNPPDRLLYPTTITPSTQTRLFLGIEAAVSKLRLLPLNDRGNPLIGAAAAKSMSFSPANVECEQMRTGRGVNNPTFPPHADPRGAVGSMNSNSPA